MSSYDNRAAGRADQACIEGRPADPNDQLELAKQRRAERLAADRGREQLGRWTVHYRQLAPDGVTITAVAWLTGTDYEGERMFDGRTVEEARAKVAEWVARKG